MISILEVARPDPSKARANACLIVRSKRRTILATEHVDVHLDIIMKIFKQRGMRNNDDLLILSHNAYVDFHVLCVPYWFLGGTDIDF